MTWDACFVERRYFIKHYTLLYYNLSPAQFIYSHLPEEEKWQLLPEIQTRFSKISKALMCMPLKTKRSSYRFFHIPLNKTEYKKEKL